MLTQPRNHEAYYSRGWVLYSENFHLMSNKGPVSGFIGIIPVPMLESKINRKHYTGANSTFLLSAVKMHYV